ncbi:hypothetical protein GCM10017556_55640 [Micromonospora sagamiensis]|nr:hypothetical protein GCM10017556_55640 [Micromonospora sagamiensis]
MGDPDAADTPQNAIQTWWYVPIGGRVSGVAAASGLAVGPRPPECRRVAGRCTWFTGVDGRAAFRRWRVFPLLFLCAGAVTVLVPPGPISPWGAGVSTP